MLIARFFSGLFYGLFAAFGAAAFLMVPLGIIGWIANIVQILNTSGPLAEASTWTVLLAIKVIAVFLAPLGAVMGWIGFFA